MDRVGLIELAIAVSKPVQVAEALKLALYH
jgi:hypothetical protein